MSGPAEVRRCAGALIVDSHGRIFVTRRAPNRTLFADCWDVVGGHVEPGESFEQAMRREVTEETGWQVAEILGDAGRYHYVGDDGIAREEQEYLVRVTGDLTAPRLDPVEHTEGRWITAAETALLDESRQPGDVLLRQLVEEGFRRLSRLLAATADAGDD